MNKEENRLYTDFLVRYRLPRPVSRSYETAGFSKNEVEASHRIKWCARVTVRFLALLRQAHYLQENPGAPVNVPSSADFKLPVASPMIEGMMARPPVQLLQLAEILPGHVDDEEKSLHESLGCLDYLTVCSLIIVLGDGFLVLTGPRLIHYIFNRDHDAILEKVPRNTVLLYNSESREFLSLTPLIIWKEDSHEGTGHLMMLKETRGDRGFYSEDGMPGAPAMEGEIHSRPRKFSLDLDEKVEKDLQLPPTRFKENRIYGNYHIFGVIWRGGTCDVYVAQKHGEPSLCVLKTFENQGVYDENFYRFMNEERYSSLVDHEQVIEAKRVRVGDFGLVLEQRYVSGGSLGDILDDNGVFTEEMCLDITKQVLAILSKIHDAGIIHNDIKPGNIIIDKNNRVHIIDFGIAYNRGKTSEAIVTGIAAGSKGFMAPEITAHAAPSCESDIYSTGVVMALMLCGKRLSSYDEAVMERSIHKKFHSFLHRCLSHCIDYRFQSAEAALAEIKKILPEKRRYITLDIEGTLVTNYQGRHPRPGLESFLSFCAEEFHRIFIYTLLNPDQAREVFDSLLARGLDIEAFSKKYEYIYWQRGREGSIKDLRRCPVPLEENMIVDDMPKMVPEDQHHRYIHVQDYNEPTGRDGGLLIARQKIEEGGVT